MPAASSASPSPATSGASGPMTTKSIFCALQKSITAAASDVSSFTHVATSAMPALPGAQKSFVSSGDAESAQAKACSRPPEPIRRTFITRDGLDVGQGARSRTDAAFVYHVRPTRTLSDKLHRDRFVTDRADQPQAAAAKTSPNSPFPSFRTPSNARLEEGFGYVRLRGEVSGYRGPPRFRPLLFRAEGRQGQDRGRHLAWRLGQAQDQARRGHGGHCHRQDLLVPRLVQISDRHRLARARGPRRPHGAARGAQEALRRRRLVRGEPQEGAAVPAPASWASSPSPTGAVIRDMLHGFTERFPTRRHRLARARAGRGQRRRGRSRRARLQRHCSRAA